MSDVAAAVTIRCIRTLEGQVVVEAEGAADTAQCPACGMPSDQIHGHYRRRPLDLPWRGRPVRLVLTVRRFRCPVRECERDTFGEQFPGLISRQARRTVAATAFLVELAEELGGEAGARVACAAGLPVSPDTVLRLLEDGEVDAPSTPRVLGVDDFALRRRHRYGTLLVDLKSHRPVDLLEDRRAETLEAWLQAHPGVEVVVRDRSGAYAEGTKAGAPNALQVADRFHLVQNATQALEELLRGRPRRVVPVPGPDPPTVQSNPEEALAEPEPEAGVVPEAVSPARRQQMERAAARVARWEEVHARRARGEGFRKIAREMQLARGTVHRLLQRPRPSSAPLVRPPQPGGLDSPKLQPFAGYIQQRWGAGMTNVASLFREVTAQGFSGSYSLLEQTLRPFRPPRRPSRTRRRLSARWLCLRPAHTLTAEEHRALEALLASDADLARGYALRLRFHRVVTTGEVEALNGWLADAQTSGLAPFISMAHGIELDRAAVDAALTTDWSNGPVEGHIHRLKLLKRQGYGRAGLSLLRRRVLAA